MENANPISSWWRHDASLQGSRVLAKEMLVPFTNAHRDLVLGLMARHRLPQSTSSARSLPRAAYCPTRRRERPVSTCRTLRRSRSQGREAGCAAGEAAHQAGDDDQPESRQGARPRRAFPSPATCRTGYRIGCNLLRRTLSAPGTWRRWAFTNVRSWSELTWDRRGGIQVLPSRPGELHPEPPTERDLTLSHHPARAGARKLPPSNGVLKRSGATKPSPEGFRIR
jgi:hypothetical protein